jgi:hypothetical protein
VAAVRESVGIYERLASATPFAFAGRLHAAAKTLADLLGALGRSAEAAEVRRRYPDQAAPEQ